MKKISLILSALAVMTCASQAAILVYTAALSGPNEAPANASPGTGIATVTLDTTGNSMRVQVTFSGLTGTTTASHIHASTALPGTGTAGVATQTPSFFGFPLGVTSGSMDTTFNMTVASNFNAAYITANGGTTATAWTALQNGIAAGKAYLNIHTSTFGGGEIRGFLAPVPEPGSVALIGLCGAGLAARRRRRA